MYILIGEILETAKAVGFASPLATIFTEFAAEAVEILSQPSHPMYGKVNKLLQKSPSWNLSKFVTYWDEKVLLREPEDDRGHPCETTWLLKLLIRGLRDDQVCSKRSKGALQLMNETGHGTISKKQYLRQSPRLIPIELVLRYTSQADFGPSLPLHQARRRYDAGHKSGD